MISCYLVVNQQFATAFDGRRKDANKLATATTKDGRIVVSLNAVNEFPEVFKGIGQTAFATVWLGPEDLPQGEPLIPAEGPAPQ